MYHCIMQKLISAKGHNYIEHYIEKYWNVFGNVGYRIWIVFSIATYNASFIRDNCTNCVHENDKIFKFLDFFAKNCD